MNLKMNQILIKILKRAKYTHCYIADYRELFFDHKSDKKYKLYININRFHTYITDTSIVILK